MIHSCSYYCLQPKCALQQRDEMRELLISLSTLLHSFGCEPPLDFVEAKTDSERGEV